MSHRYPRPGGFGGRRGYGHDGDPDLYDDDDPMIISDRHGAILDMSAPRPAGEPRPGPWHQIIFEAMGGPFRCKRAEGGCQAGGGCDNEQGRALMEMAAEVGYRGPPDPRQVRRSLQPYYDDIVDNLVAGAAPFRVILPGGGPPVGGDDRGQRHAGGGGRHGGGRGGNGRASRHPDRRRHGGGGGGGGHGSSSRHQGGGHQHGMGYGYEEY
ncbi:MAG: hypothetical protein Q9213_007902 [Squamulea squamosa]